MRSITACLALLCVAAAIAAAGPNWTETRTMVCLPVPQAPTIDGNLDDPAWSILPPSGNFFRLPGTQPAPHETICWVGRDDEHIYVALHAVEPNMAAVRAEMTEHDADFFGHECLGVVLFDVGHESRGGQFVELAANLLGTRHDAFDGDHDWNGQWRVAAQRTAQGWSMEFAIPFSDLGRRPQRGELWGMAIARHRVDDGVEQVYTCSPVLDGSFWHPENFGHLVFDSLEENLLRDIVRLERRMAEDRVELSKLVAELDPYNADARAVMALPGAVAAVRLRVTDGLAGGEDWAPAKHEISRAERAYDDAVWNLRLEPLFAQ